MDRQSKTNWDPHLYDDRHRFVSLYAQDLIGVLNPQEGERILDLGCGTGLLSNEIAKKKVDVVGIDHSKAMIEQARCLYKKPTFKVMDGHHFQFEQSFDAVFSNAALHWMLKPSDVIDCVWNCLKPRGRFVLEMGGKSNLHKLLKALEMTATEFQLSGLSLSNYYPSISEYTGLLEEQGFIVNSAILFDRPTCLEGQDGLRNWVRMFRSALLNKILPHQHDAFFERLEQIAQPYLFQNHSWVADYVRLRVVAFKPDPSDDVKIITP